MSEPEGTREEPSRPVEREAPGALELLRWSATMILISLLIGAIAIPILNWLGFKP